MLASRTANDNRSRQEWRVRKDAVPFFPRRIAFAKLLESRRRPWPNQSCHLGRLLSRATDLSVRAYQKHRIILIPTCTAWYVFPRSSPSLPSSNKPPRRRPRSLVYCLAKCRYVASSISCWTLLRTAFLASTRIRRY